MANPPLRVWAMLALALSVLAGAPAAFQAQQTQQTNQAKPPANKQKAKAPTDPDAWPDAKTLADRRKSSESRRLFRSEEPLEITITANFKSINNDRVPKSTKSFPGTLEYAGEKGTPVSMPITIRGRGNARRQICASVPLRLDLPKDRTRNTVMDGHGPIDLGTHCSNSQEELVLREYAAYKIYNMLTPRSFRARLVKATYVDATNKKPIGTRFGMFIEDEDDVAKRMEGRIVDLAGVTFNRVDPETMMLMSVFEYMIGNTDMSMYKKHNVRLVQTPAGLRFPVPYDFDYSGLVDASYAIPAKHFGLATVRDRLYLGPCRTAAEFEPFFEKFRAIKSQVMAIYDALPGMSPSSRNNAKNYLEQFYRTIDRPGDVKRAFIDNCDNRPYM